MFITFSLFVRNTEYHVYYHTDWQNPLQPLCLGHCSELPHLSPPLSTQFWQSIPTHICAFLLGIAFLALVILMMPDGSDMRYMQFGLFGGRRPS